ncbi:MAG: flippase-like domain-containing protein, partial [Candidatus Aminicenantes bacterium]|nr:flippase-like domain-containing protein [Candidatus Aminicenantes bacterium]
EPGLIKKTFLGLPASALAAFIVLHLLGAWLRAWRYKLLLHPLPCPWSGILLTTFIRNSFDDLLPARVGSLSYIYVLNQRLGFSFESATSSFIVAFVLDFLTLGPFLLLALAAAGSGALPLPPTVLAGSALAMFMLSALVLWKLAALTRLAEKGLRSLLRLLRLAEKPWAETALRKIDLIGRSLDGVRSPKRIIVILCQSFLIRLTKYVSVYFLLCGFLRGHGYRPEDIGFWKTVLGLTGAEFTAILPVKGLGGFGTWEAAWTATFRLLGFPGDLAVVSGLGVHLTTNILEYGLGAAAILLLLLTYLRRGRAEARRSGSRLG